MAASILHRNGEIPRRARMGLHVAIALGAVGCSNGPAANKARFSEQSFESASLVLTNWDHPEKSQSIEVRDRDLLKSLLVVLDNRKSTSDHKCADAGSLILHARQGSDGDWKVGILPGHNDGFYELRIYSDKQYEIFQVDRAAFLAAARKLGVTAIDQGKGKLEPLNLAVLGN